MMAALNLPHLLLLLLLLLRPSHSAGPCASPSAADVAACQAEGEAALGPYTPQSWEAPVCGVVARMAARYDDLSREEWTECVSFVSALDTARSPRLRALQLSMLRSHVAKLALWHQRERDEMYSLILKQQSTLVSAANLATRQQNFAEKQLLLVEEQLALLHQLRARVLELEAQQRAAAAASFPAPAGGAALQRSWQDACLTAAGALAFFYAVRLAKQRLFGP